MPEMDPKLAAYGARVLGKRRGAEIRTNTRVRAIEPGKVHLAPSPLPLSPATGEWDEAEGETIEADSIVLVAADVPSNVVDSLPVEEVKGGHSVVDGTSMGPCTARAARKCGPWEIVRPSQPPTANPTRTWLSTRCARPERWPATSVGCSRVCLPSRSCTTAWG